MFGNVEGAADASAVANFAEQYNGIGVGEDIAGPNGAGDEVFKHDFVAGVEEHAADGIAVVGVLLYELFLGAEVDAEEVASEPVVFFAKDLVVEVIEEVELEGVGIVVGGFDAIDDAATDSVDEVAVEPGDGLIEPAHEVGFEFLPFFGLHVADGDAATTASEGVEVVGAGEFGGPDGCGIEVSGELSFAEFPAAHSLGVFGLVLGIAAGCEVEDDAGLTILSGAGVGVADTELGLADSGGTHNDGQGAWDKSAAQGIVEFGDTSGMPRPGHVEIC